MNRVAIKAVSQIILDKLQFYKNIRAINLVIIFFQAKLIEDSNIFNLLNKRTKRIERLVARAHC